MVIWSWFADDHSRAAGHARDHHTVESHVDVEGSEVTRILNEGAVDLPFRRIEEDQGRSVFPDYETGLNVLDQRGVDRTGRSSDKNSQVRIGGGVNRGAGAPQVGGKRA